jgi:two-component system sensor histidine kinase RegB
MQLQVNKGRWPDDLSGGVLAPAGYATRRLRLHTLIQLRWLAVAGQTVAVLVVGLFMRFELPMEACFAVIALSAALNLFLKLRFPPTLRLKHGWATLLLAYDILQVGALLYLTGGLENPFCFLILVPVIVSASTLEPRHTIILGAVALAVSTTLALPVHFPLPGWETPTFAHFDLPEIYIWGIWTALACALVFMGIYAFRVAEEARQLADALTATELVLAREQHLTAIDGLAAAAAHELGTPLATIALVATELERALPPDGPLSPDIALLKSQAQRCREILGKLTSLSLEADWHHARHPLSALLEEVVEPHRALGFNIRVDLLPGPGPEPSAVRNPAILYGLGNLVENAVDFAESLVSVSARWTDATVTITIMDDGPGFADEIIDHIGEPYVTTRRTEDGEEGGSAGGLGLGFFIAKTLLERTGGRLELSNRSPPQTGAIIRIHWPREALANPAEAVRHQERSGSSISWRTPRKPLFGRHHGRGRFERLAG